MVAAGNLMGQNWLLAKNSFTNRGNMLLYANMNHLATCFIKQLYQKSAHTHAAGDTHGGIMVTQIERLL